jgi:type I restriction enzyme, S subunit
MSKSSWQSSRLGEVVSFTTGKLDSNAASPNGRYPFFTCSQETLRTDTFAFDDECVLLAGNNANGIYPLKYFAGRFDAYQRTYVIRPKNVAALSVRYLYYSLRPQLELLKSVSTGATTKFLTLTILNQLPILLPDPTIQKQIVEILSCYDDLIDANARRIRIVEEMIAALYREWIVNSRATIESKSSAVPEGWRSGTLGDIAADVRRSVDPDQIDPETPYIGLEHLPRRSITLSDWGRAKNVHSTKLSFRKDEILFGKIRPYFHKVGVAPIDGVASSDAIIIAPKSEAYFGLVVGCVSSDQFVAHATQTSQGTKMPRANWDVLLKYPVSIPPAEANEWFDQLVRDKVRFAQNLMFRNRILQQTRDMLLNKLLAGEIDVSTLGCIDDATVMVGPEPILKIEPKPEATAKREAPDPFKEAVLIAAIVRAHTSPKYPTVARFRRTKIRYLVHRKAEHDVRMRFQKQAAGPYDSASRYKGPEAIALKNKYVEERKTEYGPAFAVGKAVDEIDKYMPKYGLSDALDWVMKNFKFKKNPELELLTTVDYAALDLISRGEEVSCASIRDLIASEPKWLPKLDKNIFSDIGIESALQELQQHFGKYE